MDIAELGVLIGKGGFYGNVFRITPPLCFTKEDAGRSLFTSLTCRQPSKLVTRNLKLPLMTLVSLPQVPLLKMLSFWGADFLVDSMDYIMSKM